MTEWNAEIYQNRYKEINENKSSGESKRNKTNERENHQSRKGIDKWQEEMDILKSDISQIKEYIKIIKDNKND